jgi:hypothetical protein
MYYYYSDKIFQKNPEIENHNFLKTFTKNILKINNNINNNNELEKEKEKEKDLQENNHNENHNNNEKEKTQEIEEINNPIKFNSIDEIFSKYLEEVASDCNKEYFEFITKFVILFRECINKVRRNLNDINIEFSVKNNADTVPDTCNEFITDFMENNDYFGLDTMELIDIIQHLCNWMYENKYTTSKLTLVS